MTIDLRALAFRMIDWMSVPGNFLLSEFAVTEGMSRKSLYKLASEDEWFREKLDIAKNIEEVKVAKGALGGSLKADVALKLLGTFHGWNDSKVVTFNEPIFNLFMNEDVKMENIEKIEKADIVVESGGGKKLLKEVVKRSEKKLKERGIG